MPSSDPHHSRIDLSNLYGNMITSETLADLLKSPNVKVIDVSSDADFEASHISGHFENQIVQGWKFFDYKYNENLRIENLVDEFSSYLQSLGINGHETLVFTESDPESGLGHSSRGEFIMKLLGYPNENLFVLSGGNTVWRKLGYNVEEGNLTITPAESPLVLEPKLDMLATREDVISAVNFRGNNLALIDVRTEDEWLGNHSSPGNRDKSINPGRIPNSININWSDFMEVHIEDESFDSFLFIDEEKARKTAEDLAIQPDSEIILYCYKGARASFVHKTLTDVLGFQNVKVYLESWAGYANSGNRVETNFELPAVDRTFGTSKAIVGAAHKRLN